MASVKWKNWTPIKHSVLCSTSDCNRRPSGLEKPAILKPEVIPTVFPVSSSYLQPTHSKQRRTITRRAPSEPITQESNKPPVSLSLPPCEETYNQE